MTNIMEFFEPSKMTSWFLKVTIFLLLSYIAVWLVAIFLDRLRLFGRDDAILKLSFAWLIPLTLHCVALLIFELALALSFRKLNISLWYCTVFIIPIFLSAFLGMDHVNEIDDRITKILKRLASRGVEL